jgi:transposase
VLGVDVAKSELIAVVTWSEGGFERPWRVESPGGIGLLVSIALALSQRLDVTVAMESSGTYGDSFRQACHDAGLLVHRVSAKAVKDYAETFDGVPSQHDGKDAAVIGDLCKTGKSVPWPWQEHGELEQELRYWVRSLDTAQRIKQVYAGKLEALLARHWPEAHGLLKQSSATLLMALARWGDVREIARDPEASSRLKSFGGSYLSEEKIVKVIDSARSTLGVRMNAWETREMLDVATAILGQREKIAEARRHLKRLTRGHEVIEPQAPAIGLITACVLWMCIGDPRNYGSAAAYRKAMGLNLKERSSGTHKGKLSISKRGQRLSRKWLYFSALRWLREEPVKGWVQKKRERDGGNGSKAVVGVMRRLALAAYHVGRSGEKFEPGRLFAGSVSLQPSRR